MSIWYNNISQVYELKRRIDEAAEYIQENSTALNYGFFFGSGAFQKVQSLLAEANLTIGKFIDGYEDEDQ